jgi:hypothetical protein
MFNIKTILQLGIGVAVGMLVWHFVQKAMDKRKSAKGFVQGQLVTPTAMTDAEIQAIKDKEEAEYLGASGSPRRRTQDSPCTQASTPYWDRRLCVRTGGIVNENSGPYGGCCY